MKRNLSQLLQTSPSGGHSKEAFDLHNYEYFHQKGAQLNIASIRSVAPGCDYELSVDSITRSDLCNTANFADIKENWYILFVPNFLVSNNAYQMLVQRRQDYSAIRSNIEQFPVFDLKAVVKRCLQIGWQAHVGDINRLDDPQWFDVHGFCIAPGALRLLDMAKYGCYIDLYEFICAGATDAEIEDRYDAVAAYLDERLNGIYPSVQNIGAYQCAWYSYFRNSIYDVAGDASCYNFDDVVMHAEGVTPAFEVTAVRGVDDFIQKCLKLHYVGNKKDMFMGSMPGTQFGACASVPMATDLSFVFSGVTGTDADRHINNFPEGQTGNQTVYRTYVSHYKSDGSIVSGTVYPDTHTHQLVSNVSISKGYSLFDVLTLVQSQAMQKWRQKSMLAGNKTIDQFRAHHGEVPRHLVDHLPDFIGSLDNMINVTEITSTANTLDAEQGTNNLGEIRGRGYGVSDVKRKFHFHSSDYGTVLLLHSIVTENVYPSFGLAYDNRLIYYSDFFQQEFQNIGLEAVPKFLLDVLSKDAFGAITDPHPDASLSQFLEGQMMNLFGMYAKYFGYKEYFDQVHGLFNPTRIVTADPLGGGDRFGYADLQSFVVPRADMVAPLTYHQDAVTHEWQLVDGWNLFNLSRIYQNPRLYDSIFGTNADDHFTTDHFFTKCRFNVDALLPMTKLGLPNF